MANKQYIYIDDSGDPGTKMGAGSSAHIVFLGVYFKSEKHAKETSKQIDSLRESLAWKNTSEFKFRKTKSSVKELFFSRVLPKGCAVYSIVAAKENLPMRKPDQISNYTILELLRSINPGVSTRIYIDGEKGKKYTRKVKTYLRQNLAPGTVKSLEFRDSIRDNLLQLADMLVGAVADIHKSRYSRYQYVVDRYSIKIVKL